MLFNLLFFSVKRGYRDVLGFVCMLFINIVTYYFEKGYVSILGFISILF